jgi:hypothetical protein
MLFQKVTSVQFQVDWNSRNFNGNSIAHLLHPLHKAPIHSAPHSQLLLAL